MGRCVIGPVLVRELRRLIPAINCSGSIPPTGMLLHQHHKEVCVGVVQDGHYEPHHYGHLYHLVSFHPVSPRGSVGEGLGEGALLRYSRPSVQTTSPSASWTSWPQGLAGVRL